MPHWTANLKNLRHFRVIVRIVRLTIDPSRTDEFVSLYEHVSARIRQFDGCRHLELWQDVRYSNIYTTCSHWRHHDDLDAYRESAFFKETWSLTRRLLAAPAEATSYRQHSVAAVRGHLA